MKRAVSISIGSSKRDKAVEINLLGTQVCLERIGTDGDMARAARMYKELDGVVDAFGVGGTDLGLLIDRKYYPLHSVQSLVAGVRRTPVVDGNGLKITLERQAAQYLDSAVGEKLPGKKALIVAATDRWGMAKSFHEAGYECIFGDMMFGLGLPVPLKTIRSIKLMAALLLPIMGRVPFHWLYPNGKEQERRTPKWEKHFQWATVIAGDGHYITKYMPDRLEGKTIVTNTTTPEDVRQFREAGVRYLLTTTPVLEGRSFGTNMMEAGILAASGRKEPVDYAKADGYLQWLEGRVAALGMKPQVQELN